MTDIQDGQGIDWHAHVRVDKYSADQLKWVAAKSGVPFEIVANVWQGDQLKQWLKHADEAVEKDGNLLTYVGLAYILSVLTGVTTTTIGGQLGNGFLPIAVGDGGGSVPTASVTDSDLAATTNKYYNPVDASYPAVGSAGSTAGVITVQSTFTNTIANFTWNEWAIYGNTSAFTVGAGSKPSSATMINHKGTALGTKASGSWTLNATLTLS